MRQALGICRLCEVMSRQFWAPSLLGDRPEHHFVGRKKFGYHSGWYLACFRRGILSSLKPRGQSADRRSRKSIKLRRDLCPRLCKSHSIATNTILAQ
jgi:hypothetical protein